MKRLHGEYISFTFKDTDLQSTILSGTFVGCDFGGCTLNGLNLVGTFVGCDFSNALIYDATLEYGKFTDCCFSNTAFD